MINRAFLCAIFSVTLMLTSSCKYNSPGGDQDLSTVSGSQEAPATIKRSLIGQHTGRILFDTAWKFTRGGADGAEQQAYNDANWTSVDLPHDWSIEDLPGTESPFNPKASGQVSTGFTTGGTGWYRKSFHVPASSKGKKIFIEFEGVYMNADVWINGHHLGNHPYGYTSFQYDLTEQIQAGASNNLAVCVKNEGQNSRWYSGSGIYRHVWLRTEELLHIEDQSNQTITTKLATGSADLQFISRVENESSEALFFKSRVSIIDMAGKTVGSWETSEQLGAHSNKNLDATIALAGTHSWSIDSPYLYTAVHKLFLDETLVDSSATKFGIRSISFTTTEGFKLNGNNIKLKGGCVHHDNGPLGAKAYDRAEERKVTLLKESGFNALRCAHNPPSPAFLDACDRLGMLVIDEAFDSWNYGKNAFDYHLYFKDWYAADIESMVRRDRNHPSIILWSTGNEIPESNSPEGVKTSQMLAAAVRKFDTTRLITGGVCNFSESKDPFFESLDVSGYNYALGGAYKKSKIYETDHKRNPNRIMFGAESYPIDAFENWMYVTDHPYVAGDFVWTAFDYIGEASIGWLGYPQSAAFYPWNLAFCGDIDICGFKRPQSYYRDALWKKDQLSIFVQPPSPTYDSAAGRKDWSTWNWYDVWPDWNWRGSEQQPLNVSVYSSCEEVELLLNGKSLGRKKTNRSTEFKNNWQVLYAAGTLQAVGYTGGKQVNIAALKTAMKAKKLRLSADRQSIKANGQDLSYITVEVCDESGTVDPKNNALINFSLSGEGSIVAVGNADPMSTESFTRNKRKAWKGKCLVIVKAGFRPGKMVLTASSPGLNTQQITLTSN